MPGRRHVYTGIAGSMQKRDADLVGGKLRLLPPDLRRVHSWSPRPSFPSILEDDEHMEVVYSILVAQ